MIAEAVEQDRSRIPCIGRLIYLGIDGLSHRSRTIGNRVCSRW